MPKKRLLTKREPLTHAERCKGTVMPAINFVNVPKGWTSQVGQQGGKPAVAVYKGGELKRVRYLVDGKKRVERELTHKLPTQLMWLGKRQDFRILGQVRHGTFEALAVTMANEPMLVANLTDSLAINHGFDTPNMAKKLAKRKAKGLSPITVLTTTYPEVVRIVWYHREKQKVLKRIKLERM